MKPRISEGMHRELSPRDRQLISEETKAEIAEYKRDSHIESIAERVHIVDAAQKALTGRKVEDYESESCISRDQLFPEGARILNIGDPWQTLDLPGVVSMDYESGEEAEFSYDVKHFLERSKIDFDYIVSFMESIAQELGEMGAGADAISLAKGITIEASQLREYAETAAEEEYDKLGDAILKTGKDMLALVQLLEPKKETYDDIIHGIAKQVWYTVQRLGRGYKDTFLITQTIEQELQKESIRRKGLPIEERNRIAQAIIARERFAKRMKQADYVKGTFPDVPYPDQSFDRITASWSLSTHMFPIMEVEDFSLYWEEINRLLKKDGFAVLWPVFGCNDDALHESLLRYKETGGDAYSIFPLEMERSGRAHAYGVENRNEANVQEAFYYGATLIIFARGTKAEIKGKVVHSIIVPPARVMEMDEAA